MIGAIIGDIAGSRFEFSNYLSKTGYELLDDGCTYTDDSVMTCAVADLFNRNIKLTPENITKNLRDFGHFYANAGYGSRFAQWLYRKEIEPYNSYGNGAAMRISPVGWAAKSENEVIDFSYRVTAVTHSHPEGIKGAECVSLCIYHARQGASKEALRKLAERYYILDKTVDGWRRSWAGHGKEICQISVPQALVCFLEATDFEDCIRNCISIGGDTDTVAAIAGGIAEAYFDIPEWMERSARRFLPTALREITKTFDGKYKK